MQLILYDLLDRDVAYLSGYKILVFNFEILTSFCLQLLEIVGTEATEYTLAAAIIIVFGSLLIITSLVVFNIQVFLHVKKFRCHKKCFGAVRFTSGAAMLVSVWIYFIGENILGYIDNYGEVTIGCNYSSLGSIIENTEGDICENIITSASLILVSGILGFRFVPYFNTKLRSALPLRDQLQDVYANIPLDTEYVNQRNENINSKETESVQTLQTRNTSSIYRDTIFEAVGLIPEFDLWYTVITGIISQRLTCDDETIAAYWIIYGLMLIGYTCHLLIIGYTFKAKAAPKVKYYKLLVAFTLVVVWLTTAVYTISDTYQPLTCMYRYRHKSDEDENFTRFCLVVTSMLLYSFLLVTVIVTALKSKIHIIVNQHTQTNT